jgi:DHA3 family macrolide efflux protein-like MFS transporter
MHCIGRQTVGQTLSLFGSSVVQYAIFWYLVLRSNSGMVMTGAMVTAALPQAIVSMFGGVWADRWNRKLLVMLPDAVIAAVTICLSASMAVGWGDTGLILVVMVIRSAGGGIQTPAVQSFIPQIAPEAWLLRVNAINGTLQTAISIASPAIAAALVNLMPLWMIMLVDVSTAIVGIGFVALIRLDDARLRRPGESSDDALRATSISVSSCSPIPLTDLPRPRTHAHAKGERRVPQGRVLGLLTSVLAFGVPAGMLVFGPLAHVVDVRLLFVVGGLMTVPIGAYVMRSARRNRVAE